MKTDNKFNDNKNNNNNFNIPTKSIEKEKPKDASDDIGSDFKKKLANKKAISSEDFIENNSNDSEAKYKLNNMKGQTAISSDDLFGNGKQEEQKTIGSTLKDYALKFTLGAAEKAKDLKDKTKSLINTIQSKYGNN